MLTPPCADCDDARDEAELDDRDIEMGGRRGRR